MVKNEICFPPNNFLIAAVVITIFLVLFFGYIITYKQYSITTHRPQIYNNDNATTTYISTLLKSIKNNLENIYTDKNSVNKYPEQDYINSRSIQKESSQVGFVSSEISNVKLPLYEQVMDRRYYYHTIVSNDNSLIPIKIPIKSKGDQQLYDSQIITIPEVSDETYIVKLYEITGNR